MRHTLFWEVFLPLLLILVQISVQAKKQKSTVISDVKDLKEFKKLLRTKTNVLILFVNNSKSSQLVIDVFKDTADAMKGHATLVMIDCANSETKKLCKKLKISNDKPYYLKHYKDGDFHKDYDRSETVSSMSNFLRDPTGDLPWEEDPEATDIFHLKDSEALLKFLKKGAAAYKKSMIMFYAPWCGYCKTLKPEYVGAAADLKGEALLAAIDVAKPGNSKIRQLYNITGFPTLLYYEKGQLRFPYNGDNKRQAIVDFMRDPAAHLQHKKKEVLDESWSHDSDVVHLSGDNFDSILSNAENALVVFYAPWCGHCKRIKPEFEKAAARIKAEKLNGVLAAVDATKEPELASRFGVKGYPTLKYFSRGEYRFDAGHARQEEQIVSFIKEPGAAGAGAVGAAGAVERALAWSAEVRHLDADTFRAVLRRTKHALVMFYAPWCGHCRSTESEFSAAAERFAEEVSVAFAAVDCTRHRRLCDQHHVQGYPTIKYYSHFDRPAPPYTLGRKEADFVSFMERVSGVGGGGGGGVGVVGARGAAQSAAAAGFGASVELATDADFDTIIARPTPTFVMFYATWCGHCVSAKPAFSRLATALRAGASGASGVSGVSGASGVRAVALDAAANPRAADAAAIHTLPAFKLYAGGTLLAEYTGDRTTQDMLAFCNTHATATATATTTAKDEL